MTVSTFSKWLLLFSLLIFSYSNVMTQNEYIIHVDLQHPKEIVWETLIDFKSYSKWNTVLTMDGNDQLEIDQKFKVTITDEKGKTSSFKAKTLTKQDYVSFSARQVIIGKWFFSATHHFILEEKSSSQTTFTQKWEFSGILFKPMRKLIFAQLDRFNQMNGDLSTYLEKHSKSSN